MKIETLYKILTSEKPSQSILEHESFVFSLIPELKKCRGFHQNNPWHIYDVYEHILHVVDHIPSNLILRLAALFHDIGKPQVYKEDEKGIGHFYGHWIESQKIFLNFANHYKLDENIKNSVSKLIFYHDIQIDKMEENVKKEFIDMLDREEIIWLFALKRSDLLAQNSKYHDLLKTYSLQEKEILDEYSKQQKMISPKRIEQYKKWFDNLSFFQGNSFVIDTIEDLYNLTNYIRRVYDHFYNNTDFHDISYTIISKEETIHLSQTFFNHHHIPINIEELIQKKILMLKEKDEKRKDHFYRTIQDGISFYDTHHNKRLTIFLEGTLLDSIVLIHELLHYINQPKDKRNVVSDLLTEALSYGGELIFCEELDGSYLEDQKKHFQNLGSLLFLYASKLYYIYKIILLYKKKGDINPELYNELFDDHNYMMTMDIFEHYTIQQKAIFKDTWYIVGIPIAIYILEEYKKDDRFFERLKKFNTSLNDCTIWECLKILNLNDKQEFIDKIKNSNESFTEDFVE